MSYQEALRVLELELADKVSVRRAYLRLVKIFKPETNPEGFRRLREAYDLLRLGPRGRPGRDAPRVPFLFLHAQPGVRRPTGQRRGPSGDTSAFLRLQQLLATDPHGNADEEFATFLAGVPTTHRLVTAFTLLEKHATRRATQAFISALGNGVPAELDRVRGLSTLANSILEQLASGDIRGAKSLLAAAAPWLDACPLKLTDPAGLRVVWTLVSELAKLPDSFPATPRERWAAEIRNGLSETLHAEDVPSMARNAMRGSAPLLSSMLGPASKATPRRSASRQMRDTDFSDFVPLVCAVLMTVTPVLMRVVPLFSMEGVHPLKTLPSERNPLPPGADRAEQSARVLCAQQHSGSVSLCVDAQALSAALSQGLCTRARQALQVLRNELGNEPTQHDLVASFTDDVEQLCQNATTGFLDIGPR